MEAQPITPAPTNQNPLVEDAALTIYDSLSKEGFSTEDKIAVVKSVSGLIRSDIDDNIKQLQRLKNTF